MLHAENATYPWYPASVTKLMTAYTTLRAIREGKITLNTLLTVGRNAAAEQPSKMGFPPGTQVTVDNALKMLLVHSANDIAVVLAEGVSGSIANFSAEMNATAKRLPDDPRRTTSIPTVCPTIGKDLGARSRNPRPRSDPGLSGRRRLLAHSLDPVRQPGLHNCNSMLDQYPGTDGMKTGFICASGYNVVATATRDDRRLIAIILGAYSSAVRAQQAAQLLLETGFNSGGLSWLTPSLGTVDALAPIDAQPPNLREEMCGRHRRKPPSKTTRTAKRRGRRPPPAATNASPQAFMLSSLKPANGKFVLGGPVDTTPPIVVFTGPADHPDVAVQTESAKPRKKKKAAAAGASRHAATAKPKKKKAKVSSAQK